MEDLSYLMAQNPVTESVCMLTNYCSAEVSGSGFLIRIDVPGVKSFQIDHSPGSPVVTFCNNPSITTPSNRYVGYTVLSRRSPFIKYDAKVSSGVLVIHFHNCHGSLTILRHPYRLAGPPGVPVAVRGFTSQDEVNISALLTMLESSNEQIKEELRDLKLDLARELSRGLTTHLCKVSSEIKGEGKTGAIYSAVDEDTGLPLAVKTILLDKGCIDRNMVREMCILLQIQHPSIVRLHYVFPGVSCINLAMESCEDDISALVYQCPHALSDPNVVKDIMYQILSGVAFLHEKKILHRNLNLKNILYLQDSKKVIKLADFGLARMIADELTPQVTSLLYRAPELLLGARSYTTAVDVWSVGCVFAELVELRPFFCATVGAGFGEHDMIHAIFRKLGCPSDLEWPGVQSFPNYPDDVSQFEQVCFRNSKLDKDGNDLLLRLLSLDPSKRIGAAKALEHPYFLSRRT